MEGHASQWPQRENEKFTYPDLCFSVPCGCWWRGSSRNIQIVMSMLGNLEFRPVVLGGHGLGEVDLRTRHGPRDPTPQSVHVRVHTHTHTHTHTHMHALNNGGEANKPAKQG